jgi:hypothetical protein
MGMILRAITLLHLGGKLKLRLFHRFVLFDCCRLEGEHMIVVLLALGAPTPVAALSAPAEPPAVRTGHRAGAAWPAYAMKRAWRNEAGLANLRRSGVGQHDARGPSVRHPPYDPPQKLVAIQAMPRVRRSFAHRGGTEGGICAAWPAHSTLQGGSRASVQNGCARRDLAHILRLLLRKKP